MCAYKGASRLDLVTGKSLKWHTYEACRELKGHDSWSTTRQNVPLKTMSIERVRVEEFGESNDEDCG